MSVESLANTFGSGRENEIDFRFDQVRPGSTKSSLSNRCTEVPYRMKEMCVKAMSRLG